MTDHKPAPGKFVGDKVIDHTRVQLSALFDGELALDEARFLQRRLQHDPELGECVSRWQLAGDILRGQATAPAPSGFAERVAAAVAADAAVVAAPTAARRSRWNWGSGVALAASVAAVALFMGRQAPDASMSANAPSVGIASTVPAVSQPALAQPGLVQPDPAQAPAPNMPIAPDTAAQLAAASIAVAAVPRRVAARRGSSRAQLQRAAATRASRAAEVASIPQLAVASAAPGGIVAIANRNPNPNPFDPSASATPTRPWPRALLPNAGAAFNVGYGSLQPPTVEPVAEAALRSVHPFRPRPATLQPQDAQEINPSPR